MKNTVRLLLTVVISALLYPKLFPNYPEVPVVEDKWFGKTLKPGQSVPKGLIPPDLINKFTVNVSNDVLEDLRHRLQMAKFSEPLANSKFNYGFRGDVLKDLVQYWLTKFDWRKQELILNKYNQYMTLISGLGIHYIHVKPTKPAKLVIPIMVIHGWPGSVWEYYKAIPLLTEPVNGIAFEVVAPSIPGFGFSDAPQQQGFDIPQTARIFVTLMKNLKLERFIVHGGDYGHAISRAMAVIYPDNNNPPQDIATQLKFLIGGYFPSLVFDEPEAEHKKLYPQWDRMKFIIRESGYLHLQATKPDTIGAALVDSPVGLLAYILEKFSTWTDPSNVDRDDGGLGLKFTRDELITNVMIYWVSNNVAASMRYYKESFVEYFDKGLERIPVSESVPTAVADFANELIRSSQTIAKQQYKTLLQHNDMTIGGHFAAFEVPEVVVHDIRQFVDKILIFEQKLNNRINN